MLGCELETECIAILGGLWMARIHSIGYAVQVLASVVKWTANGEALGLRSTGCRDQAGTLISVIGCAEKSTAGRQRVSFAAAAKC